MKATNQISDILADYNACQTQPYILEQSQKEEESMSIDPHEKQNLLITDIPLNLLMIKLEQLKQDTVMKKDLNDEIEVSDETLSFHCTLSLKRIEHALKGRFCKHPQCFDADTFFQLGSKSQFKCGVCNQIIKPKVSYTH